MADPSEPEPERRRRRPASSCTLCRKRKLRCNRETPCSNCMRSRRGTCVYGPPPLPSRPRRQPREASQAESPQSPSIGLSSRTREVPKSTQSGSLPDDSARSSTPATREIELLKVRVRQLEDQLSRSPKSAQSLTSGPYSDPEIATSDLGALGGTFHVYRDGSSYGQTRAVSHKSRLYGRSNWANDIVVFLDIIDLDPRLCEDSSKTVAGVQKCKYLARIIKAKRSPWWPCVPTTDLPPRDVADDLVNRYLRTTETLYRILHIPSFRKDYEAIWSPDAKPETSFLVQLKLVLALGAVTYDDLFSLRVSAIRWVYEAQTWISAPQLKARMGMGINFLQTSILLLLAREALNIDGDTTWVSAGTVLRTAMLLGLHRDPSCLPKKTIFIAEMRRRLWNTILELTVQSSLSSGGPPLISLTDFDTEPPGNFNDDEILIKEQPVPKPDNVFTRTSVAIALRKMLPIRLEVLKLLNNTSSAQTYEETLRLDTQIKRSYKSLYQSIQAYSLNSSDSEVSAFRFGIRALDMLMLRYISALHGPYLDPALDEATYAFSRKVIIETSLKIWLVAYPGSAIMTSQSMTSHNTDPSDRDDDLARYITCGSGLFRLISTQAPLLISLDFRSKLQEEEGLGPVPFRPDVLSIIEEAKVWSLQCIKAGETNIKPYLLIRVVAAQIEALVKGATKADLPSIVTKTAEDANDTALSILEKMAQEETDKTLDELHQMSFDPTTPDAMEDWDFTVPQPFSDQVDPDMSWGFNDDSQLSLGALLGSHGFT